MILDLVAGGGLDRLAGRGPANPEWVAHILACCLDALGYAHREGVLHRDIKPANILLDDRGQPLLADFGIAKAADSGRATKTGALVGTFAYMAPELFQQAPASTRSDLYALGLVAWELLVGRQACPDGSAGAMMGWHMFTGPALVQSVAPSCPAPLASLVTALTAKDPGARPESPEAALAMLRGATVAPVAAPPVLAWRGTVEAYPAPAGPTDGGLGTVELPPSAPSTGRGSPVAARPLSSENGGGGLMLPALVGVGLGVLAVAAVGRAWWSRFSNPPVMEAITPAPVVEDSTPAVPDLSEDEPEPEDKTGEEATAAKTEPPKTDPLKSDALKHRRTPGPSTPNKMALPKDKVNCEGTLTVSSTPKAQVLVDRVFIQQSPLFRFKVDCGRREVRLINSDGRTVTWTVDVEENKDTRQVWNWEEQRLVGDEPNPPPTKKSGPPVPASVIDTIIRSNSGIKRCYLDEKTRSGTIPHEIDVSIIVEPHGGVSDARVTTQDWRFTDLGTCLSSALRSLIFPSFDGPERYTFAYRIRT